METFLACGCREQDDPAAPFVARDGDTPSGAPLAPVAADGRALAALAALAARPTEALALAMHAPFCHVRCLCCARSVLAAQPGAVIADHVDGLAEEIALLARQVGGTREVLAWHLGGGTADQLSQAQLAQLMQAVQDCWTLPAEAELSLDADPRQLGETGLLGWRALGFRELRLRVFDLDAQVQQAIGRHHSTAPVQCGIDAESLPDAGACAGLAELAGCVLGNEPDPARWRAAVRAGRLPVVEFRRH